MTILEEKKSAIETLCQAFQVVRLDVFGAITEEGFDPSKDQVMFAVTFAPCNPQVHYERFFGLQQGLEVLVGCSIELIDYKALLEGSFLRHLPKQCETVYRGSSAEKT